MPLNHWRNVEAVEIDGHWHARGEYVCMAEGGTVYPFSHTFDLTDPVIKPQRRAEIFVSRIS